MAKKPGNRGKTDKVGAHRVAFDAAAALDALKWATGGQQIELPGIGARRFVGVEPLPDDGEARAVGRPPGAQNLVPAAFREYLAAKYGSPVEGLAQFAGRPVVSIVAELVEAWRTVCQALGYEDPTLTRDQVLALVTMVPGLQLQAKRYAAPYMHTAAPQATPGAHVVQRIGVLMMTGQATPGALEQGKDTLASMLGIQRVTDAEPLELDAKELDEDV